jgi:hypothetical protein
VRTPARGVPTGNTNNCVRTPARGVPTGNTNNCVRTPARGVPTGNSNNRVRTPARGVPTGNSNKRALAPGRFFAAWLTVSVAAENERKEEQRAFLACRTITHPFMRGAVFCPGSRIMYVGRDVSCPLFTRRSVTHGKVCACPRSRDYQFAGHPL